MRILKSLLTIDFKIVRLTDIYTNIYTCTINALKFTLPFKKKLSYAHQCCIFLMRNPVKIVILWNIIVNYFVFEYVFGCGLCLWCRAELLQTLWSFRNSSNVLMYCSRNISSYQCWRHLCCLINLLTTFTMLQKVAFSKKYCFFEISIHHRSWKALSTNILTSHFNKLIKHQ